MKILVTSDTHGNLEGLDVSQADVICFAGDIAPLKGRGKWHMHDQKKWVQKKLCRWAAENPSKQFIFTPGNHDFFPIGHKYGPDLDWKIDWPENCHMLIDSGFTYDGISFYGSPWVPIISYSWAFELETSDLEQKFSMIPENIDVLLTHSPPALGHSYPIDRSLQWGGTEAFGSAALADAIFRKSPRYAFCGHIHTGSHQPYELQSYQSNLKTTFVNVSRVDENYEIAYEPFVFDIEPVQ